MFINTSGHGGPEWVLSSPGVAGKIREIAEEAGFEVYGVTADRSNLPSSYHVSTSEGVIDVNLTFGPADELEKVIRDLFLLSGPPAVIDAVDVKEEPVDMEFVPSPDFDNPAAPAMTKGKKA